jgi:hypothetical protein
MSDEYETPAYTVDEIRTHDSEYINPLPKRTSFHVNSFAVQGRRDMLHHFATLTEQNERLREAFRFLLDRYTQLVNCGDCGDWDPETERPVIAAREALSPVSPNAPEGEVKP